jgi:hypothetical protein
MMENAEPIYQQGSNPTGPRLVVQVRSILANINIINRYMSFNNTLDPDLRRYVKYHRYPRIPGMLKIEFNLGLILPAISPGVLYSNKSYITG